MHVEESGANPEESERNPIWMRIQYGCGEEYEESVFPSFCISKDGRVLITNAWPGLPRGVKFDPSDEELLWHLLAKVGKGEAGPHPFISEFIIFLDNDGGIDSYHPSELPGVKQDGSVSYFFHRTSKSLDTGSRGRWKIDNDDIGVLRWHKVGKSKPVDVDGIHQGCKNIMVLYMTTVKGEKPERTNWVMHQYHVDGNEHVGEIVVSKIFYQLNAKHYDKKSLPADNVEAVDRELLFAAGPRLLDSEPHKENLHPNPVYMEALTEATCHETRLEENIGLAGCWKLENYDDILIEDSCRRITEAEVLLDSQNHGYSIIANNDLLERKYSLCTEAESGRSCVSHDVQVDITNQEKHQEERETEEPGNICCNQEIAFEAISEILNSIPSSCLVEPKRECLENGLQIPYQSPPSRLLENNILKTNVSGECFDDLPTDVQDQISSSCLGEPKLECLDNGLQIPCQSPPSSLPGNNILNTNVKRVSFEDGTTDGLDQIPLRWRIKMPISGNLTGLSCSNNGECSQKTMPSSGSDNSANAEESSFSLRRRKRKKTVTDSVEKALEEDAPGLLQVLLDKGITVEEIKLYGEVDDNEAMEISSSEDSFEELGTVITKLFPEGPSFFKLPPIRQIKGSRVDYCLSCLISLIEQVRYLRFRQSPVEWGWCRDLQSFIFIFERHNRIVLERPEYGYATYFFELVESLPIDWQIKRLVTAMKLPSCSRMSLLENRLLLVGRDLTEGEARVLGEYGWTPNSGLGTMLNYCDRVVHDKKSEKCISDWRAKIGKLLMSGHDGGQTVLPSLPKKVLQYIENHNPEVKLEV